MKTKPTKVKKASDLKGYPPYYRYVFGRLFITEHLRPEER